MPCTPAYDSGDRTGSITVTTDQTLGAGTINNLVDGASGGNSTDAIWISGDVTGKHITFDFGSQQKITETTWTISTATGSNGTFKWQGSNNGSSFSDIGSGTFTLNATTNVDTTLSGNTNSYRYYRALGVSDTSATNWITETTFKRCPEQIVNVGQVTETDLAQAIAVNPLRRLINQATETDLAQAITARKTQAVGQVTETDLAQAITYSRSAAIGQATETDLAQAITVNPLRRLIGQAAETDLARGLIFPQFVAIGQVMERDGAWMLGSVGICEFPPALLAEMAQTSCQPVWLLVVRFATGTLYLSDSVFTLTGWAAESSPTTKAWVKQWGYVDSVIASELGAAQASDFTCILFDDQGDSNRWSNLVENATNKPALTDCELYLWGIGLDAVAAPPFKKWQGTIRDPGEPDTDQSLQVIFEDEIVRKLNPMLGTAINTTTFSGADTAALGKVVPMPIGSVTSAPAEPTGAAAHNSLALNAAAGATTIYCSNVSEQPAFPASGIHIINGIEVPYSAKSTASVGGITYRTFTVTALASAVKRGALVLEKKTNNDYVIAPYAVKQVDNYYANGVRIAGSLAPAPAYDSGDRTGSITVTTDQTLGAGTINNLVDGASGGNSTDAIWLSGDVTGKHITFDFGTQVKITETTWTISGATGSNGTFKWQGSNDGSSFSDIGVGTFILNAATNVDTTLSANESEYRYYRALGVSDTSATNWITETTFKRYTSDGYSYLRFTTHPLELMQAALAAVVTDTIAVGGGGDTVSAHEVPTSWTTASNVISPGGPTTYTIATFPSTAGIVRQVYTLGWTTFNVTYSVASTVTINEVTIWSSSVNAVTPAVVNLNYTTSGNTVTMGCTGNGSTSVTSQCDKTCSRNIFLTGAATKSGTVAVAATTTGLTEYDLLNMRVTWDGGGAKDDAAGTFTGTPAALIERPDRIYKWALNTWAARAVAAISTPAEFTTATGNFYKLAHVIKEKIPLKDFLQRLAWQSRCYNYQSAGVSRLIWRTATFAALKTLTVNDVRRDASSNVTTLKRGRSNLADVINVVEILYDLDPSGVLGWRKNTKALNAPSITAYGRREKPEKFEFDLVSDAATAADVRAFYLARYKDQHRTAQWESFLNQAEIDFAAKIALTHSLLYGGTLTGEVIEADLIPGSRSQPDRLALTIMGA